jgi:hypothetical protein
VAQVSLTPATESPESHFPEMCICFPEGRFQPGNKQTAGTSVSESLTHISSNLQVFYPRFMDKEAFFFAKIIE